MIAPESRTQAYLWSPNSGALPKPVPISVEDDRSTPARTLADLYKRCGAGGGCPYTIHQIIRVLQALRYHGRVVVTDIAAAAGMPASAVYGCVLEAEDYGLACWIEAPVLQADHITAEISEAGLRFLREIEHGGSV